MSKSYRNPANPARSSAGKWSITINLTDGQIERESGYQHSVDATVRAVQIGEEGLHAPWRLAAGYVYYPPGAIARVIITKDIPEDPQP